MQPGGRDYDKAYYGSSKRRRSPRAWLRRRFARFRRVSARARRATARASVAVACSGQFHRSWQLNYSAGRPHGDPAPRRQGFDHRGFGGNFQPLASAELYDPSTGKFTLSSNMNTPRAGHTAILLANGKVLIAGGVQDSQFSTFLVSAEIDDPSIGTFAATGNMILGGRVRSSLLPDERVFIAEDGNTAEIYDPASGTFALTSAYPSSSPVLVDTATSPPDGRVLVTGCAAQCSVGMTGAYDSHTGMFSATGSRRAWDAISTATLLINGTVLFVEGNDSALPDDAEIYDPTSGVFTHIGFTSDIHEFSAAARLPDGTVLIAGGQLAGGVTPAPSNMFLRPACSTPQET